MTTDTKHHDSPDTCKSGARCAECCELIPVSAGNEVHTREIDDVVYHFCGPDCYQKWRHSGDDYASRQ